MKTSEFHYELPRELIAQSPPPRRAGSRMMILDRAQGRIEHGRVSELPARLSSGDLLVVNDTRVIPARVFGHKEPTGGWVEVLLIEKKRRDTWESFVRSKRGASTGTLLSLAAGEIKAKIIESLGDGRFLIKLKHDRQLSEILRRSGVAPLPPYIKRDRSGSLDSAISRLDKERYQTVFAKNDGAIAAPTAGLHLSDGLLNSLRLRGVKRAAITLHVGPGTFTPVRSELVEEHAMEAERYVVSKTAARLVESTRSRAGKVVAVGSTVVRTLETVASNAGEIKPARGRSALFIFPPYSFKAVDAMLTNFHLPESTLLMMVCAFAGTELVKRAYREAIEERYRFYSYGDCMLIL